MEKHKGVTYHATKARECLIEAYEHLLKAAENNEEFEYKNSIKEQILENAKGVLSILETRSFK